MELAGKTAFISGAGGGIGQALVRVFARAGANLVITDRNSEKLDPLADELREAGTRIIAQAGDLIEPTVAQSLVEAAIHEFGGLDCAVNAAGAFPPPAELASVDEGVARQFMEVDFWTVFHCMRAQLKPMLEKESGSIVNISSGAGLLGFPMSSIYCAAKHAVVGVSRAAAIDYSSRGIRVNVICPGMTLTPPLEAWLSDPVNRNIAVAMHPIGRLGKPEEIADAALWLCSDRSSFVTGIALPVDGGFTAH